jgi:hypothetical protein
MSNIIPFSDQERMAKTIAKSGLFGLKDEVAVLALMAVAQAEGRHPASVAKDYHLIQGRPALKADAMLARFQQAGGKVEWTKYTDDEVRGVFSHPQGGSLELAWTLAQARAIGLATKDNWKLYPRAMLRARVISEGIRSVYPAVIVGEYTPEEVQDFNPSPAQQIREITIPQIEITDELEDDRALSEWALYVPDGDDRKLYANCPDKDDFMSNYSDLTEKILGSTKIKPAEKDAKLEALEKVNIGNLEKFRNGN